MGGREERRQTRTRAFWCESLAHHKHASWVVGYSDNLQTTVNDLCHSPWIAFCRCLACLQLLKPQMCFAALLKDFIC